jgi:signal peptidase II
MVLVLPVMFVRLRLALLTISLAVIDQGVKWLANEYLIPEVPHPVLPGIFNLTLTYNTGAAFSLLNQFLGMLTAFSALLFLILIGYSFTRTTYRHGESLALALLMGGALGNLLDRVQSGRVTDFLDVVWIHYPIFNGADIFIFFGALILLFSHWRTEPDDPHAPELP